MKKYLSLIIAVIMTVGCLSGCGSTDTNAVLNENDENNREKLQIVTTIFPEYDWVNNVLGDNRDNAEVTLLLNSGVDLHSFQPTVDDILKISTCDMFVYVGGESDEWVEDALKEATNKDMVVVNLLEVLGDSVKEEEVVEGMQAEDEEDQEHEEDEIEYDEHVWLSLRNAVTLVKNISENLQKLDAANAENYRANAESYIEKLNKLDEEYAQAVADSQTKILLFGDRFPFRYLVNDYGLTYYAAFVGCSAETEASFETISFLAKKVDEFSLHAVMTIEGTDHRIAETIVQNTEKKDQSILTMDSMQSVTSADVENGTTYLSVMENNLSVLREALK